MNTLPLNIGTIHFVGIGGIGMSGIAEILNNLGYSVQGSDISDNANVQRLRALGIKVFVGHKEENVEDAKVVVISTAVKPTNPEVVAARAAMIPVVRRAEMLAELMRLKAAIAIGGTHGKTTTTSLVATMLDAAGLDPTVINGGIINSYGTNARLGESDWMVVEADESDGTFVKVPSTISVVTNIDPEHLDHWKDFDQLREAFKNFVQNIPFYGFAVLCIDHPEVQALIGRVTDRRIFTFGFSPQADVRAVNVRTNIGDTVFDVVIRERVDSEERVIKDVRLPMVGDHNVSNSLAAITVALELGIPDEKIVSAFDGFTGVKRRFTKTGEVDGVTIIDDYGHHPVEIKAVLKAARQATQNNVIAVVQPHRYSRLHDLFEDFCTCFNDADSVIVADVYEAGETPIEGASRDALVEGLRNRGHRHVSALEGPEKLAEVIKAEAKPGDLVVCLGAGSISAWANALPAQLEAIKN
ncbi:MULTISPECIES: UDP-N-acetylmuramate--L-alanine ligase [Thalassospira]|uniref:UDP-N-acetylmuramate--L-alanine ligase n=3 Tax=Thalassospira TaxID=168934 RepID=A0A853L377_9PROT|nr:MULTISPECIES: UDP-N-acetylmuramate--L-alanine ligase [Thalassospira]MBO6816993.1 UDP-N-acetylmuramate--L-alanine ligase [Thalassospira sp.]MBO6886976.1 UDP-N-acetylmuramate--L-alanine ligase [Thalassospira sp.]NJB74146.1 UDP-N-acetylmuramate--alanine ligase [Thalassospira tepidiphila]OAZ11717.1 UDP-N-acetylmuramate--alanine ligase [Thalassospira tepidiphila MCCC 1A03514]